ncbi:MAG: hypothetical protein Ta2B_14000 [Termitinemataceae bacterium]|nr:MAG: hypothetical protein Ta2B_14000 [Termitinemataceae bacterium]
MKKTLSIAAVMVLLVAAQAISESKPIMGYDKVKWGTSVQKVRSAYKISAEILAIPEQDDPKISRMTQENVSDSVIKREFFFNDGKLYRVHVSYKDASDTTFANLRSALESKLGTSSYHWGQDSTGKQIEYWFEKYSPDLLVELRHFSSANSAQSNWLTVTYTWKKFRDAYQASKLL